MNGWSLMQQKMCAGERGILVWWTGGGDGARNSHGDDTLLFKCCLRLFGGLI